MIFEQVWNISAIRPNCYWNLLKTLKYILSCLKMCPKNLELYLNLYHPYCRFVKNVDFLLYQNTNWEITYGPSMRLKSTENVPTVITEVNKSKKFISTLTSSILKVGRKISSVTNVKWVLFTNKLAPIIWNSNVNIQVRNHLFTM